MLESSLKDINFGIFLIGLYFIFEFGSIQGLFPLVNDLKLPYILSIINIIYALIIIVQNKVDFKSLTTKRFFMFCFFIVVYSIIATNNSTEKTDIIKLFLVYLAQYVIIITCVKKPSQFILLINIWLLAIAFSCYHGIMQGGKVWGNRWLKDENHISLVVAIAMPFAFILYKHFRYHFKKLFYIIYMVLGCTITVIAASRGGALSLIVVIFLCLTLYNNKIRNISAISVILLFVLIVYNYGPQTAKRSLSDRLATTIEQGSEEGTVRGRIVLWELALRTFADHPLLGVGVSNFPDYAINNFYEFSVSRKGRPIVAHSTPLQFLAETGLMGGIILLLLQVALYKNWKLIYSINKDKVSLSLHKMQENISVFNNISHACMISQIGFWIGAMFLTLLPYPFYWCLIPFSEAWKNIYMDYLNKAETSTENQLDM